jgi:hypothetical protein
MIRFLHYSSTLTLAALVAFGAADASAATGEIGFAVTSGAIRVNDVYTRKNASLFEGTTIQTTESGSSLSLRDRAQVDLGVHSRGRVYGDHLVLEDGVGRLTRAKNFTLQAGPLRIVPDGNGSNVSVTSTEGSVQVTSLSGKARVVDTNGSLLAKVDPGMTAIFAAPVASGAGAGSPPPDPQGGGGGRNAHWALIFLGSVAVAGAVLGGLAAAGTFSSSSRQVSVP